MSSEKEEISDRRDYSLVCQSCKEKRKRDEERLDCARTLCQLRANTMPIAREHYANCAEQSPNTRGSSTEAIGFISRDLNRDCGCITAV